MDEDRANANSEMRYIALELTKLSKRHRKPFKIVATEFVKNVYHLEGMLRSSSAPRAAARKRARSED